jgi:tetratricopeptide (TPR) repeat protein
MFTIISNMRSHLKAIVFILPLSLWAASADSALTLPELFSLIHPTVATVITYDVDHKVSGIGSGFFINQQGHFITNFHVLKDAYFAEIKSHRGNKYPITLILADDEESDLIKAQVMIPPDSVHWVNIEKNLPEIAEPILVVGSPMGLDQTASQGIVSAIREMPRLGKFFQITAPISTGSSGSPVVNRQGRVIGVATFMLVMGQNLNFAIGSQKIMELQHFQAPQSVAEWTYHRSSEGPKLAEDLCRRGFQFSLKGDFQKALSFYQQAVSNDPGNPDAWYGLGHCYAGLDQPDRALEAYHQASRNNPSDAMIPFHLGRFLKKMGRYQEALSAFQRSIGLNPDFGPAYDHVGLVYAKLERYDDAITAYYQVLHLQPEYAPAYFNIGMAYGKMGKLPKALLAYKQAIRINPQFVTAYNHMGMLFIQIGEVDNAIETYKNALRLNPNSVMAHFNIGSAYLAKGHKKFALEEYIILKSLDDAAADKLFNLIYQ